MPEQLVHDLRAVVDLAEVQHILDHIIAKGVLAERQRMAGNLLDEPRLLRGGCVVDAPLQDAAAVSVGRDVDTVRRRSLVDKLRVLRAEALQAPLDHVVPVEVLDEGHDSWSERLDNGLYLLSAREGLDQLLHRPRPVCVEPHGHEIAAVGDALEDLQPLLLRAAIQELLDEVVPEGVHHECDEMLEDLRKDDADCRRPAVVKLALEEPASVLVLRGL
mmetsp:Transcript_21815/g.52132  ORF Transcript_21815/g.52132 Transcript_21815/m.52132 type:complete len:218 (-) Transcript_21815:99-752(-)